MHILRVCATGSCNVVTTRNCTLGTVKQYWAYWRTRVQRSRKTGTQLACSEQLFQTVRTVVETQSGLVSNLGKIVIIMLNYFYYIGLSLESGLRRCPDKIKINPSFQVSMCSN